MRFLYFALLVGTSLALLSQFPSEVSAQVPGQPPAVWRPRNARGQFIKEGEEGNIPIRRTDKDEVEALLHQRRIGGESSMSSEARRALANKRRLEADQNKAKEQQFKESQREANLEAPERLAAKNERKADWLERKVADMPDAGKVLSRQMYSIKWEKLPAAQREVKIRQQKVDQMISQSKLLNPDTAIPKGSGLAALDYYKQVPLDKAAANPKRVQSTVWSSKDMGIESIPQHRAQEYARDSLKLMDKARKSTDETYYIVKDKLIGTNIAVTKADYEIISKGVPMEGKTVTRYTYVGSAPRTDLPQIVETAVGKYQNFESRNVGTVADPGWRLENARKDLDKAKATEKALTEDVARLANELKPFADIKKPKISNPNGLFGGEADLNSASSEHAQDGNSVNVVVQVDVQ